MAEEMSRRGLFCIVGGLLAAFGLAPRATAQPLPPTLPAAPPAFRPLTWVTYDSGIELTSSHCGTYTYYYTDGHVSHVERKP